MRIKLIAAAVSVSVVATCASAADWQELVKFQGGVVSLDQSTFIKQGSQVQAWVLFTYLQPQPYGNTQYDVVEQRYTFDCANWKYATTSNFAAYRGQVVYKDQQTSGQFLDIPPSSMTDQLARPLCSAG